MTNLPRVTFGMIVLNGDPYIRYNLRALYPFAHQIIVVEGASHASTGIATGDGHSSDGTLDVLRDFKADEDSDGKLIIVTAEDEGHSNGFWPGEKDEQSQAYARRATGDYLWQVDVDEFYRPADMHAVMEMIRDDSEITAVSFKQITFWGGFEYLVDGWYLRRGADIYHRLFKWGHGYRYVSHRPPTVVNRQGTDLRNINWVDGEQSWSRGILLFHYSLALPKQVRDKVDYYAHGPWGRYSAGIQCWAENNFFHTISRPYQVHNMHTYASWLDEFRGRHPESIRRLKQDLERGALSTDVRHYGDIRALLSLSGYQFGRRLLRFISPFACSKDAIAKTMSKATARVMYDHASGRLYLQKPGRRSA